MLELSGEGRFHSFSEKAASDPNEIIFQASSTSLRFLSTNFTKPSQADLSSCHFQTPAMSFFSRRVKDELVSPFCFQVSTIEPGITKGWSSYKLSHLLLATRTQILRSFFNSILASRCDFHQVRKLFSLFFQTFKLSIFLFVFFRLLNVPIDRSELLLCLTRFLFYIEIAALFFVFLFPSFCYLLINCSCQLVLCVF